MPNLLQRAILAASQHVGLLARPWRGLDLPMRVHYGPSNAHRLLRDSELPDSLPSVIGAVSLLCDAIVGLPWELVRQGRPTAGTEVVDGIAAAHALAAWPLYARWAWAYSALVAGNGVAHVERDGRDAPAYLRTYPAPRVSFRLWENARLSLLLVPPTAGQANEVDDAACAILRYRPCGWDERIGISPLIQASETVELLLRNRRMVSSTMRNAARPSGYLKTEHTLRGDIAEAIKERWQRAHGGDGAGGTAVLEQGLSYEKIDLADLQALAANETARLGVGDIARLYNVPPALLIGTEQNRSTATEDRRRLLSFAVAPLARLIEDALNVALLSPQQLAQGYAVRVDTSVEMLGQGNEMAQAVSNLLNGGAVTVNEVRSRLGLAAVEFGNELRSPTNTWPISSWINAAPRSGDPAAPANDQQMSVASDAGTRRALMFYRRRTLQ